MKTSKMLWTLSLLGIFCAYGCADDSVISNNSCGDGVKENREACDDGNTNDGDGCSSKCLVENGYICVTPGKPCVEKEPVDPQPGPGPQTGPVCGNNKVESPETCDDGNANSNDGCSSDCVTENGWKCEIPGNPCVLNDDDIPITCGNGLVDDGEICDDGNREDNDGCARNCQVIENGYYCPPEGGKCQDGVFCGNGKVDPGEACDYDEGDVPANGDGCSTSCKVENGYRCDEYECWQIECGNGEVEDGEDCDDEYPLEYGFDESGKRGCTSNCTLAPYCGDGEPQSEYGEECDEGQNNGTAEYGSDGCTSECKRTPRCGDGVFSPGNEQCDPTVSPEAQTYCTENCKPKEGFICNAQNGTCKELVTIKCGDGSIDGAEECDQTGGGCTNCRHDSDYKCIGSLTSPCSECTNTPGDQCRSISAGYGNGKLDADGFEECDDGNKINGDGCSSTGKIESGYVCSTPGQKCQPICGDGKKVGNEECDDGNRKGGDGCTATCTVEEGYICNTQGKACELKDKCGNKVVGPNELCDGETGCGSDCKSLKSGYCFSGKTKKIYSCGSSKTCGNYILEPGEQCDDGNTLGGDGCSDTCTIEYAYECPTGIECRPICGDGKVMAQLGEKCDLGADNGKGKGCSVTCHVEEGFTCTDPSTDFPTTVNLDVTYRDFVGRNKTSGSGLVNDTIYNALSSSDCRRNLLESDLLYNSNNKEQFLSQINGRGNDLAKNKPWLVKGRGFPDFEGFAGNLCFGLVKDTLDSDGKPVFNGSLNDNCCGGMSATQCTAFLQGGTYNGASYPTYTGGTAVGWHHVSKTKKRHHMLCADSLKKWYRTDGVVNKEVKTKLPLTKVANPSKYVFDSANTPYKCYFSPIDGQGFNDITTVTIDKDDTAVCGNERTENHNGDFTTEISTMFQYKGGETLNFSGDDDVWVFINGKLFLDVGGMHAKVEGKNTLSSSTKSSPDKKNGGNISRKYDSRYGIYEGGLYELKVFHAERAASGADFKLTLDGFVNPSSVSCTSKCGDGELASTEQCDYSDTAAAARLGCVNCAWATSTCGNGRIEGNEACDTGHLCKDNAAACAAFGLSYNPNERCNESTCQYKDSLCGNGQVDAGEECDCGGSGDCERDIVPGTKMKCNAKSCRFYCGNGVLDSGEQCDEGAKANANGDTCSSICKAPTCGDGVVSQYAGEVCDDGPNNVSGDYSNDGTPRCMAGCARYSGYCGDNKLNGNEACDLGKERNTGAYGGCNSDCTLAPHCGDGIVNGEEACDPKDPNTMSGCTQTCTKEVN